MAQHEPFQQRGELSVLADNILRAAVLHAAHEDQAESAVAAVKYLDMVERTGGDFKVNSTCFDGEKARRGRGSERWGRAR